MNNSALLALLLSLPSWLLAAPPGLLVLPSQVERAAVAVSLTQPADYLCALVEIRDGDKDPAVSADNIRRTLTALVAEVAKIPLLELYRGPVGVSPYYGKSSVISSLVGSSSPAQMEIRTQVSVLLKLDPAKPDPLGGVALIRATVARVKPTTDTSLRLQSLGLAVDSPESRRAELIKRVSAEAGAMRAVFDGGTVAVSGLESPVLVRQVDDSRVELFIEYHLSVTK